MSANAPSGSKWLILRAAGAFIRAYHSYDDNVAFARTLGAGAYSVRAFSETMGSYTLTLSADGGGTPPRRRLLRQASR